MAQLSLRVDLGEAGRLGPGKIALLEAVREKGSISAAGRVFGMSYRRAWMLIEAVNTIFAEPLVTTQTGGRHGGGATLTALGETVVAHFRAIEAAAESAAAGHLDALQTALKPSAAENVQPPV
jgi:molybdate transport system regulatory protein